MNMTNKQISAPNTPSYTASFGPQTFSNHSPYDTSPFNMNRAIMKSPMALYGCMDCSPYMATFRKLNSQPNKRAKTPATPKKKNNQRGIFTQIGRSLRRLTKFSGF